ncbi:hypothetical protein [Salinigranum marinum]|uniref:hypothetical protein n=1 Tax=Salinigranum marinum TaxID=1515595 RepID=UPI002989A38C|nr:hypothetical protein [Salinigranum marinum]
MGGSFESGAGDDPNDLFASTNDRDEEADPSEKDVSPEQTTETDERDDSVESGESNAKAERSDDMEGREESRETGSPVMLQMESQTDLDAARLAREFVPDTYEKPHAWALGRDGVNDGRPEKKTFFLQSSVLDLEGACSQRVNEILDGDVPLTDLRELALILAYHQPELLAEAAREWGAESA